MHSNKTLRRIVGKTVGKTANLHPRAPGQRPCRHQPRAPVHGASSRRRVLCSQSRRIVGSANVTIRAVVRPEMSTVNTALTQRLHAVEDDERTLDGVDGGIVCINNVISAFCGCCPSQRPGARTLFSDRASLGTRGNFTAARTQCSCGGRLD